MCKNNRCSASITINNQSIVKVSGKILASEDVIVENIKNSHKDHCKPLTDTEKLSMDF